MNNDLQKKQIKESILQVATNSWRFGGPGPVYLVREWFSKWHEKEGWSFEDMQKCIDELKCDSAVEVISKLDKTTGDDQIILMVNKIFSI